MASLSSVTSSNNNYLSNLMNSTNKISGLASGLDTESMIQSLVQSYQAKINQFNQKITKLEWKQEAYRSIIGNLYNFSNKYTSYTSSTNLMSKSFFTNSVTVSALGKFADSVIASGKTNSNVSLNAVHQLATTAQYRTSSSMASGGTSIVASEAVDLTETTTQSTLYGTMTLDYNGQKVELSFDRVKDGEAIKQIREELGKSASSDEVLAALINRKLAEMEVPPAKSEEGEEIEEGEESAKTYYSEFIRASAEDGTITFNDGDGSVSISKVTGNLDEQLGIDQDALKSKDGEPVSSFTVQKDLDLTNEVAKDGNIAASSKRMSITLNGVTREITLPMVFIKEDENGDDKFYIDTDDGEEEYTAERYTELLNEAVRDAFGDKIKVENVSEDPNKLQLKFSVTDEKDGSTLTVQSESGKVLGLGETATNYLDTNKTLGELLGTDENGNLEGLTSAGQDEDGNTLYNFVINGVKVGTYTKDTKLSDLMSDINNSKAGVKVSYSKTTQNFLFETKETGADAKIEFGDGLAKKMFGVSAKSSDKAIDAFEGIEAGQKIEFEVPGEGKYSFKVESDMTMEDIINKLNKSPFMAYGFEASYDNATGQIVMKDEDGNKLDLKVTNLSTEEEVKYKSASQATYTAGQDAIFDVTVNGEQFQMTRSSNIVDIDGLSITMKDTFNSKANADGTYAVDNASDAVTFKTSTDSDKIIDAIKSMISDYNSMMADIRSAYSTMPYQSSNGVLQSYEPLTDDDKEGMTESAIARYEEKAKQGLLFGDRNLSGLYSGMLEAFSFNNTADVDTLRAMGISVSYNINDGTQTVTLDEDKLRDMLDSDPDRVADLFTKSDGIMDRMKTQMDRYGKTTGEPKGILVQQAGTPLSSLSLLSNNWQTDIDNYNKQIERWQTKLQSQVERYTSQFTRLETLINQMNSQSSALAGLMGGG